MFRSLRPVLLFVALLSTAVKLPAEVVKVEIHQRALFADGQSFGSAGPYETIQGRMYIEVDPDHAANATIHDLALAPRLANGRVGCWTDFFLLKPVDAQRGNRRILFDVNNRGNMLALWTFNNGERSNTPSTAAHAGNGFLMRHGYSVFSCGWSGDVQPDDTHRLLAGLPIATDKGKTITGRSHLEFSAPEKLFSRAFSWSPWGEFAAYPTASLDTKDAVLTMRPNRQEPAIEIPSSEWAFARWEDGKVIPDPTHVYVKEGLRPGWLYELVYTAKEPRVSGLGLAAVRDTISFLRYAPSQRDGTVNPLAGAIDRAYVHGISQSGRLINHFIYEGFNGDEQKRPIFDGALVHVSGSGKGSFNSRFRMATDCGSPHEQNLSGSEFFPLAPVPQTDPVTGESGDLLDRARASGHVPKMIFTQTSTEYWCRAASLLHTDVEGKKDLTLPPEVRIYLVSGAQHLGAGETTRGICQQPRSPLDDRGPVARAMLVALDAWVSTNTSPPPSRYPRISDGTLVDLSGWKFPRIPSVNVPTRYYEPLRLDFGPRFRSEGIADMIPPKIGPAYKTLVPAVDADGNEIAGIRLPEVAVPLGTYAGWNLRAAEFGAEGILTPLDGMYLPFPQTKVEREKSGDPRPSVQERYPTREVYLARITEAALQLQSERLLLDEDVTAILKKAASLKLW
jgi:hypothetical protein